MNKDSRIYVAGHRGLVGSHITEALKLSGHTNLITCELADLDLRNQADVQTFFAQEMPEYVFLAAARVGGILANDTCPADFIYDNLLIQANVIDSAYKYGAKKLLFLGSSCIYPKHAPQPMREESLLTGLLEPTNEPYAIAKIAGIKQCQSYRKQYGFNSICLMPTNLYGPGDNFDLQSSHVMPALIRKFHEARASNAKEVVIWGTGNPRREFLFARDLADAALYLMQDYDGEEIINVGTGEDISIRELAHLVKEIVDYNGALIFDSSKPDGTPRKLLDVSRLFSLGWRPKTYFIDGITETYAWYLKQAIAVDG